MPPLLIRAVAGSHPLQVVCAWPLSSQYGLGTRMFYYVLLATCLVARREEWLVTSCLAAAFILPTVAALHGIVLTALHNPHAVDMDIFGAFQLCSIGVIVAPMTFMMSGPYLSNPGRNTISVGLFIQAVGLLSFVVEFCRTETSDCVRSNNSKPLSSSERPSFPYAEGNNCGLICSVQEGPFSPIRSGPANNIYVIPAPNILTFGTATLLAAACCLLATLHSVFVWDMVITASWRRYSTRHVTIKRLNQKIRYFLNILAAPIRVGAALAIVIVGEINFFSSQVKYQTEPMANVGQWAPVVGASLPLLIVVSSYVLLARRDIERKDSGEDVPHQDYISERGLEVTPLSGQWIPGEEFRNDCLPGGEHERGRRRGEDGSSRGRGSSFANSFSTSFSTNIGPSLGRSCSLTMPQAAVLPVDTRLRVRSASLDPQALTTHR